VALLDVGPRALARAPALEEVREVGAQGGGGVLLEALLGAVLGEAVELVEGVPSPAGPPSFGTKS